MLAQLDLWTTRGQIYKRPRSRKSSLIGCYGRIINVLDRNMGVPDHCPVYYTMLFEIRP